MTRTTRRRALASGEPLYIQRKLARASARLVVAMEIAEREDALGGALLGEDAAGKAARVLVEEGERLVRSPGVELGDALAKERGFGRERSKAAGLASCGRSEESGAGGTRARVPTARRRG